MATTPKTTTSKSTRKVQVPGAPAASDQATQAEDATSKSTAARDWGAAKTVLADLPEGFTITTAGGESLDYDAVVQRALTDNGYVDSDWNELTTEQRQAILNGIAAEGGEETAVENLGDAGQELATDPQPEPAVVIHREESSELPDADDIDSRRITRAVLTKQGWVLPVTPAAKA